MDRFPNEYEEDKDLLQKLKNLEYQLEYQLEEKDRLIRDLVERINNQKDRINMYEKSYEELRTKNEELTALVSGENKVLNRFQCGGDAVSVLKTLTDIFPFLNDGIVSAEVNVYPKAEWRDR